MSDFFFDSDVLNESKYRFIHVFHRYPEVIHYFLAHLFNGEVEPEL